jgi:hypothetical protein
MTNQNLAGMRTIVFERFLMVELSNKVRSLMHY